MASLSVISFTYDPASIGTPAMYIGKIHSQQIPLIKSINAESPGQVAFAFRGFINRTINNIMIAVFLITSLF
jgi:hypothetical protein